MPEKSPTGKPSTVNVPVHAQEPVPVANAWGALTDGVQAYERLRPGAAIRRCNEVRDSRAGEQEGSPAGSTGEQTMMHLLFNPDDWLGRHQGICLLLLSAAVLAGGTL